jgi:hypothetical protein
VKDSLPWFRLYAEIVDDPKLKLLAFEDRWHYIALLCCKCQGMLDKEQDVTRMRRLVAVKLGVDARTMDEIERRLVAEDLIEVDTLQPIQWDRRQFRSDTDPTNAQRQKAHRERQAALRNGRVTGLDTDADTEKGAKAPSVGKHAYTIEFEDVWQLYPDRPGCNKLDSFKAWKARIAAGVSTDVMTAGVRRYAAYCRAMKTEPGFIKQPATFFGPSNHFLSDWTVPAPRPAGGSRQEQRSSYLDDLTAAGGRNERNGDVIDVHARTVG